MPFFAYTGRNTQGIAVKGVLEGESVENVATQLLKDGITPLDIHKTNAIRTSTGQTKKGASPTLVERLFGQKITIIDLMLFSRQMNTLLKAGVPILRALTGIEDSTPNRRFKEIVREMRQTLDNGRELSFALSKHPNIFDHFYVSMVRVGELSGLLDKIFFQMFEHLEFEKAMKEKISSALRYPTFVVVAVAVAIAVINIFVIPAFAKVYESFKVELPIMTRILIATSKFTSAYWYYILIAIAVIYFGFKYITRTAVGKYHWDRIKLEIPIAGKIIRKGTLARFARSFALAGRSGVPIIQALTTVAQVVDNDFIAQRILKMREGIERGESILRTATNSEIFTPIVLQMIAIGEETGSVDELMEEIAEMYQQEVEYEIKTLSEQIEPILIVVLGVLVLILALGVFLPIWDLGSAATKHG